MCYLLFYHMLYLPIHKNYNLYYHPKLSKNNLMHMLPQGLISIIDGVIIDWIILLAEKLVLKGEVFTFILQFIIKTVIYLFLFILRILVFYKDNFLDYFLYDL